MDDGSSVKKVDWKLLIEEQSKSGLTQKAYCESKGVKLSHFVYYKSQLKTKAVLDKKAIKLPVFTPIKLKESNPPVGEIKILLPNGFQCFIPLQTETLQIKNLLGVLLSC